VTLCSYRSAGSQSCAACALRTHPRISQSEFFAMAKRARVPARRSKTRKSSSTKVRTSNAERIKKAAEARRCKFSPELEARARYLFEETDASLADIAFELGIHKCTVPVVARRRNWKRYAPPPRDVSPVTRILVEAETLERRQSTAQSGPETEPEKHAGPEGASEKSESDDLVARLRRAVLNELTVVESLRDRLKNEPQSRVAAERTARTLSTLTDTLQKLQRLQCAVPANGPDYDMPADIDEFRRELARRIRAFVESRTERGHVDGADTPALASIRS
jgi:hypothetical protein